MGNYSYIDGRSRFQNAIDSIDDPSLGSACGLPSPRASVRLFEEEVRRGLFMWQGNRHAAVKGVARCDFCRVSSSRDQAAAGPALACPLLVNAGPPRGQSASAGVRYACGSGSE